MVNYRMDVGVVMRDGTRLSVDVFLPIGRGPSPALLCRSPYGKDADPYAGWARQFAEAGYAVALQDVRGRYDSDGEWEPYVHEAQDGADTIEWLAAQEWCDGRVGMFGISYVGFTQALAASAAPPALAAVVPIASQEDNFGHMWCDGVLQLQNAMNLVRFGRHAVRQGAASLTGWGEGKLIDWEQVYRSLPLRDALRDVGDCPAYDQFLEHPTFDDFWRATSLKSRYEHMTVPALFVSGWYDNLLHEQFKCFCGWRTGARPDACRQSRIVVGPWSHFDIGSRVVADVDYGPDAEVDLIDLQMRWYDGILGRHIESVQAPRPVEVFFTGANAWAGFDEWPPREAAERPLYLRSDGAANGAQGDGRLSWNRADDEPVDRFVYDPSHPVPTVGGQTMFADQAGPRDRAEVERREDVLVYTSAVLDRPLTICGDVTLRLFASSTGLDTDFTATLVDVDADGVPRIICEGIIRARYRESVVTPSLLHPGEVYEYEISLWERAHVFEGGHQVRCEVSSSNFPRFDRNLNTGGDVVDGCEWQTAEQEVWHDRVRASSLLLPVLTY
jgi:uncharacterized protein